MIDSSTTMIFLLKTIKALLEREYPRKIPMSDFIIKIFKIVSIIQDKTFAFEDIKITNFGLFVFPKFIWSFLKDEP